MPVIRLPANGWRPRDYQLPLWKYLEGGGKRAVAIWHRRAGKDEVCLHWTATQMVQRAGNYWHMLPQQSQARKAIWSAVNPHSGKRRIDEAFPIELRLHTRETEMQIVFKNGATWQVVGSDNYNSLVGSPPVGVVFSEWALADPAAWAYIRPILAENDGFALFITTPRGRNHASTFYEAGLEDDDWFAELLPATKTSVFTAKQLEIEEREYKREFGPDDGLARFKQEYLCNFAAAIPGSYYGPYMVAAEEGKRIGRVPWEPNLQVITAWDLGFGDSTAIWFAQLVGREVRIIDYYESSGVGIEHYVKALRRKPYVYGDTILPHDAAAGSLQTGRSMVDTMWSLGLRELRVLPRSSIEDGINAARGLLPRCWFDKQNCERGLNALREYHREWDDKARVFKNRPHHDWASHAADAFRYLAVGMPETVDYEEEPWLEHFTDHDRNAISGY